MANEKRLIDAERLKRILQNFEGHLLEVGKTEAAEAVKTIIKGLKTEPTVDAVEVVHGRTIQAEEPHHILMDRECEKCHCLMLITDNYCPNCGADMRGETE